MKKQVIGKIMALILVAIMVLGAFCACGQNGKGDIYVVFTGDIHSADDENIGYAGLAAYLDFVKEKSSNVLMVDTGDFIQGDYPAAVTKGDYIIDRMNALPYDLAVPGNHEFDYGVERLAELMEKSTATFLSCNISYTGNGENPFQDLKPYDIRTFGKVKVGFVGVTTPETLSLSAPTNFIEGDTCAYNFGGGEDNSKLYAMVQSSVDACRKAGADYVIVLSHLGDDIAEYPYSSREMIQKTEGIDAVLDGHAHKVIPCDIVENKNGEEVPLSSTGTGLVNIGTLVITDSGNITMGLISSYEKKDADIVSAIEAFNKAQDAKLAEAVATSDCVLPISKNGVRYVRIREMTAGNLVADAFRHAAGTDIAIMNGGGIRTDFPSGTITYGDVRKVMPFQNALCSVKATGQEIADALEFGYSKVEGITEQDGRPIGENGGFLQVSGLKCIVDTSVPTSVKTDENGAFISVGDTRRVSDIQILQEDGTYAPLVLDKEYTVASISYLLVQKGDGYTMFADNEFLIAEGIIDYQVLIDYLASMGGKIDARYADTEGRITVK